MVNVQHGKDKQSISSFGSKVYEIHYICNVTKSVFSSHSNIFIRKRTFHRLYTILNQRHQLYKTCQEADPT